MLGRIGKSNAMGFIGEKFGACFLGLEDTRFSFDAQIDRYFTVSGYPSDQTFGLMGVELIHDKDPLALRIDREGLFHVVFKILFGAGWTNGRPKDLSGSHFKVGDQALGAMPFIFKLLAFRPARLHRSGGMGALFGLDAGFFIRTDQVNALRLQPKGAMIQGTDRLAVLIKGFFIHLRWTFPIAHLMGL